MTTTDCSLVFGDAGEGDNINLLDGQSQLEAVEGVSDTQLHLQL